MSAQAGDEVGGFRLLEDLGTGGTGARTFLAEGPAGRAAVKLFAEGRAAAEREAAALATLDHPGIPRLLGHGSDPAWIALTWADGTPLGALLPQRAALVAAQLLGALAHAHSRGLAHGDLRPGNVLVTGEGRLTLVDLGLAERLDRAEPGAPVAGTPAYLAPERLAGGPPSIAADLFAAGAVLLEALHGKAALDLVRQGRAREIEAAASGAAFDVLADLVAPAASRPACAGEALERLLPLLGSPLPGWLAHLAADARLRPGAAPLSEVAEPPLVGRDAVLAQLEGVIRGTREGRGAFVVVSAETGLGRSRLLAEAVARAPSANVRAVIGRCRAGAATPGAWRDILAALAASLRGRSASEVAELLTPDARALGPTCPEILDLPYVRSLPEPPDLSPDLNKFRVFSAMTSLLRSWSRREPLVLILDDVQWADHATLELAWYLVRNVVHGAATFGEAAAGGALTLVLGRRKPSETEHELLERTLADARRTGLVLEIALQRLAPDQVRDLVSGMLPGAPVPRDLAELVAAESGGSPHVAVELVRSLHAEGLVRRVRGEWRFAGAGGAPAGHLADMLRRRLDRVGPSARRLLAAGAILGADFETGLAAETASLPEAEAALADEELRAARLTHRVSDTRRAFAHEQLRQLVADDLEPAERAALHRLAGGALERAGADARGGAAEIARHYLDAGDADDALRCLPAAAAERRAAGNPGDALELLRSQIALLERLPRDQRQRRAAEGLQARQAIAEILHRSARYDEAASAWLELLGACRGAADVVAEAQALVGLGQTSNLAGRYAEAREHLERALQLASDAGATNQVIAARAYLVQNAFMRGRFEEGEGHATAVREGVKRLSDRLLVAEALRQIGLFCHFRGRFDEAIALYGEALQLLTETGDRAGMAATLHNLGILHNGRGEYHLALDCYERSLAIFREMGLRMGEAKCLSNIGNVHLQQGGASEAERCYLAAEAIYRGLDDRRSAAENLCNLGEVDMKRGRLLAARERFSQALAIHRDLENPAGIAQACYCLATAHLWLGRTDEAREMVAEALDRDRQVGSRRGLAYDLAASSLLQAQLGNDREALAEAEEALEEARGAGDRYHAMLLAADVAGLLLALGRPREALTQASQAHLEATSLGAVEAEVNALIVMARCGPAEQARERLDRALDLVGRSENPEMRWRAWHAASLVLREASPREATAAVDRALHAISECARRLADEAPAFLARRDVRAALDDFLALEEAARPPRGETLLSRYHLLTNDEQRARAKRLLATSLSGGLADPGELRRLRLFRETVTSSSLLSADALLQSFLARALQAVDAERGLVYLLRKDELSCRAALARSGGTLAGPEREVPRQVVEWVLREKSGLVTEDVAADARLSWRGSVADLRVKSLMAAPLLDGGELLGVLYVDRRASATTFPPQARADFEAACADLARLLSITLGAERREEELREREQRLRLGGTDELPGMVGCSEVMRSLFATARVVADSNENVMISGESGTGKELLARALHLRSRRARGPFVALDCGAIPSTLMESVLFGHVKGSFTGADRDKPGVFEEASGGTLFLDEITNATLDLQARLLRVLQERTVRRVGGRGEIAVDVRVVAATNLDLEAEVAAGRFRQDLFWRLNVIHLRLPPLRERAEDVPLLAEHFLRQVVEREGKPLDGFTEEAMRRLQAHSWPGNLRELGNCVARMAAFASSGPLGVERIPEGVRDGRDRPLKVRIEGAGAGGSSATASASDSSSSESDVARRVVEELVAGRTDFWTAVRAPLRARTLTRSQARDVVAEGLRRTSGSYKETAKLYGLSDDDYGRFMDFLRFNQLKLDFREFRERK